MCIFEDFTKRFKKRRLGIDFIENLINGFPPLDDPQVTKVTQLSLCRMQGKTCFKHNLLLIKALPVWERRKEMILTLEREPKSLDRISSGSKVSGILRNLTQKMS